MMFKDLLGKSRAIIEGVADFDTSDAPREVQPIKPKGPPKHLPLKAVIAKVKTPPIPLHKALRKKGGLPGVKPVGEAKKAPMNRTAPRAPKVPKQPHPSTMPLATAGHVQHHPGTRCPDCERAQITAHRPETSAGKYSSVSNGWKAAVGMKTDEDKTLKDLISEARRLTERRSKNQQLMGQRAVAKSYGKTSSGISDVRGDINDHSRDQLADRASGSASLKRRGLPSGYYTKAGGSWTQGEVASAKNKFMSAKAK